MKNKVLGEKEVFEKFGVKPDQVIDVQSLIGDSSDNVPGVPGIGPKTAAELINKYKTLDQVLKNANQIKQKKRKESLINNQEKAILSKKLVTLKKDVPIKEKLESFILKNIDKNKLYNFLKDMEFNRLLSQAISFYGEIDLKNTSKLKNKEENEKIDVKKYECILNKKQLDFWVKKLNENSVISIDTETSSLNPLEADLVGVSFSYEANKACYIPLKHKTKSELSKEIILRR